MKKIYTCLVLCILACGIHAQTYLDTSATWSENYGYFNGINETHNQFYHLTIKEDTVIGPHTYYKIRKQGIDSIYNLWDNMNYTAMIDEYFGALREDAWKWYIIFPNQTTEYLLFDFSKNVGDPIMNSEFIGTQGCGDFTVDEIDTVYLGPMPRKRFHLTPASFPFIEGVGVVTGLTGPVCQFIESGSRLICFRQQNFGIITDTLLECDLQFDTVWDAVNSTPIPAINLSLFPNPADELVNITLSNRCKDCQLEVFDINGRKVTEISIATFNDISVNIENWASGAYYVRLSQNQRGIAARKFMKR